MNSGRLGSENTFKEACLPLLVNCRPWLQWIVDMINKSKIRLIILTYIYIYISDSVCVFTKNGCMCTWMQGLLWTHLRAGTDNVDHTARVPPYALYQPRQVMDLGLERQTTSSQHVWKMYLDYYITGTIRYILYRVPEGRRWGSLVSALVWWPRHSASPIHGNDAPRMS